MSEPTPTKPSPSPRKSTSAIATMAIVLVALVVVGGGAIGVTLWAVNRGDGGATPPVAVKIDPAAIAAGKQLTMQRGCVTCHSDDGSANRGPTYKGLFGSSVTYTDGTTGIIDEAEVRDALVHPAAKVIDGFEPLMPVAKLTEDEQKNLIAYLRSIGAGTK